MRLTQVAIILATLGVVNSALAGHSGSAEFDPRAAGDQLFVADTGNGLDTGCTFRNGGPLLIKVGVDRFIGKTNDDGTLNDAATLIEKGVVGRKARVRFPVFDIDSSASVPLPLQPEVDYFSFNGHRLERAITGVNNGWVVQEFEVPIEWVKFSSARGAPGEKPALAFNEIRIDIDQANSELVWCMQVDWVEIEIKSMAPLLLVHGIAADSSTWDAAHQYLESEFIPHDFEITLGPNDTVDDNGHLLARIVQERATSFGAKRVHLVAHSKGGKDSMRYLSTYYDPNDPNAVQVLSLHTLSTPHFGSVIADITIAGRTRASPLSNDLEFQTFLNSDWWAYTFGKGKVPKSPGLDDLQTGESRTFVAKNPLPGSVDLYTFGADADLNNDGKISEDEAHPLLDALPVGRAMVGTNLYKLLRNVSTVEIVRHTGGGGLYEWHEVNPVATAERLDNDLSVTDRSSNHPQQKDGTHTGPLDRNHSNIKDAASLTVVMGQIRARFPLN